MESLKVKLPKELKDQLFAACKEFGATRSAYIRSALEKQLAQHQVKFPK